MGDPGVAIGTAVQVPPAGAGADAFIEMLLPHVLFGAPKGSVVHAEEAVPLVQAGAKHAASPRKVTASEHDCPDGVHVQPQVSGLPVGPAFASRAIGYPVGQRGAMPIAPVQRTAGPTHPSGTGWAHV
jgi:hypothetical protein